jgi:hypothetical protein
LNSLDAPRRSIERIEKAVFKSARELPCYKQLNTLPGIGRILSMTITMEVGEIKRFKAQGNLASYSRRVDSKRMSHGEFKDNYSSPGKMIVAVQNSVREDNNAHKDSEAAADTLSQSQGGTEVSVLQPLWRIATEGLAGNGDGIRGA